MTYDAVVRLVHPSSVDGAVLIVVAAVGVAVNLAATVTMARANRRSLNVEGAYRHILTDLYGFAGTLIAGVVIVVWGFDRADAIASLVVVLLMLKAAVELLRPALRILLEATPEDIDVEEVRQHLMELPEVQSVHDLHAWTLTSALPVLTAHVVVTDECFTTGQAGRVLDHLQECLSDHFDVAHSTLQFESPGHIEHELGGHALAPDAQLRRAAPTPPRARRARSWGRCRRRAARSTRHPRRAGRGIAPEGRRVARDVDHAAYARARARRGPA